jgi:hypothetical protein
VTLPHVPATCSRCYALLSPEAQRVADVVRRLIQYAEPGVPWYQPKRTPLCQQEPQQPLDDQ